MRFVGSRRCVAVSLLVVLAGMGACGPHRQAVRSVEDPEKLRIGIQDEHGIAVTFDIPAIMGLLGTTVPEGKRLEITRWLDRVLTVYPFGLLNKMIDTISIVGSLEIGAQASAGVLAGRMLVLPYPQTTNRIERDALFHGLVFQGFEAQLQKRANAMPADKEAVNLIGQIRLLRKEGFGARDEEDGESVETIAGKLLSGDRQFLGRLDADGELMRACETIRQVYYVASEKAMDQVFWSDLTTQDAAKAVFAEALQEESVRSPAPPVPEETHPQPAGRIAEAPAVPGTQQGQASSRPAPIDKAEAAVPTLENFRDVDVPLADVVVQRPKPHRSASGRPARSYRAGVMEFEAGRYRQASEIWSRLLNSQPDEYFVIHFGVSCFLEDLKNIRDTLDPDFTFFAIRYWLDGRECFLLFSGLYKDTQSLQKDLNGLASRVGDRFFPKGIKISKAKTLLPD